MEKSIDGCHVPRTENSAGSCGGQDDIASHCEEKAESPNGVEGLNGAGQTNKREGEQQDSPLCQEPAVGELVRQNKST